MSQAWADDVVKHKPPAWKAAGRSGEVGIWLFHDSSQLETVKVERKLIWPDKPDDRHRRWREYVQAGQSRAKHRDNNAEHIKYMNELTWEEHGP
jgi:hypothetical protein